MSATPFDAGALWIKARMFINRSSDPTRTFEEQAFWAACALELLAKAALAAVSPMLIAQHSEEGENLLIASGTVPMADRFTSIPARTVWARCARIFKPFSFSEATKIGSGRNEYLHGGSTGFDAVPPDAWWPRYWSQVATLLTHLGRDLSEFVGSERVLEVETHLNTIAVYRKRQIESLLERARSRLNMNESGAKSAQFTVEWDAFRQPSTSFQTSIACPACSNPGALCGEEILETRVGDNGSSYWTDPYDGPSVIYTIAADSFVCSHCHLVLDEFELIQEAGFEESFEVDGDPADAYDEPEYMDE